MGAAVRFTPNEGTQMSATSIVTTSTTTVRALFRSLSLVTAFLACATSACLNENVGDPQVPALRADEQGGGLTVGPRGDGNLHWVVYGDTRTNPGTHQAVVDAYAPLNPDFVIHAGDLWDGYPGGAGQFSRILSSHPNIAALMSRNLFLVAQGNHESADDVLSFRPSIVRNNATMYSFRMDNAFFVVLGMDPSGPVTVAYLKQQLASPAAVSADWRFVVSHYPVWSGGSHRNFGYADLEDVCGRGKVNVFFSSHDHNYQRTYQLLDQLATDERDDLEAFRGPVYMVTGGGGAPLYAVSKIPDITKVAASAQNFVEVTSSPQKLTVKAWGLGGSLIDTFTISK
jgi:hypothetical protein